MIKNYRSWIILIATCALLPLIKFYPIWLSLFYVILVLGLVFPKTITHKMVLIDLAIFSLILIYWEYHTLINREAMITLLIVAYLLKPLEIKSRRDIIVFIDISYFFLLVHFLYYQTIPMAIYSSVLFFILTVFWRTLNDQQKGQQIGIKSKKVGIWILQSMPLMLILFITFPRISTPLWRLPQNDIVSMTGLSDKMQPGSISDLSLSDEIAFRAVFFQDRPSQSQLYWRALVFDLFDGRTWTGRKPALAASPVQSQTRPIHYQLTLEPQGRMWLVALEWPLAVVNDSILTGRYELTSRRAIQQRLTYILAATFAPLFPAELTSLQRQQNLQLPFSGNPKTREFAQLLRSQVSNDEDYINRVLAYIKNNQFIYTLSPPLLGQNSVDEFLFTTKQGFCEHFASSFTFLMRAGGIPARVVTGYQGGEFNPVGRYFIVHQYDAHAWSEVWLPKRGWIRFDPTAAAAPLRITQGLQATMAFKRSMPAWLFSENTWVYRIRLGLDAINNAWNQWVLGYNESVQREFFNQIGLPEINWHLLVTLLMVMAIGLLLIMSFYLLHGARSKKTVVLLQYYQQFCHSLGQRGIERLPHEGPLDFAARVAQGQPHLAHSVSTICRYFAFLYYGRQAANIQQIRRFRQQIMDFKKTLKYTSKK